MIRIRMAKINISIPLNFIILILFSTERRETNSFISIKKSTIVRPSINKKSGMDLKSPKLNGSKADNEKIVY